MADTTALITGIPGVGYQGGAQAPAKKVLPLGYMAESDREVKTELGKQDFLQLLAAQMQYQNPLEPQSDTDFVAQLAQFSSLESLTNMGTSMTTMNNYQAFALTGQLVIAEAYVDGVLSEIQGYVDCVYTQGGVTYAQIGEYTVPVTSINTVIDKDIYKTDKSLVEYSSLVGREVTAGITVEGETQTVEGTVTRVTAERDGIYAHIDDGSDEGVWVHVTSIFDIKQAGTTSPDPTGTDPTGTDPT